MSWKVGDVIIYKLLTESTDKTCYNLSDQNNLILVSTFTYVT